MSEYQSPSSSSSLSKVNNNNNKTLLLKGGSSGSASIIKERIEAEKGKERRCEGEKSKPQDLSKSEKTNKEVTPSTSSSSLSLIDKGSSSSEKSSENKRESKNMLSNPIENHYSREPDLRYTSLSDVSRSISSYAIDTVTANRLAMQEYDVQAVHSTNHRPSPYDSSALVNSQTAFERYDPNYTLQRTSMYSPYCQPTLEELASQQKYLLEQQQQQQQQPHHPVMKTEPDDSNNGPIYPRPIYHAYDPTGNENGYPSFILINSSHAHSTVPYKTSSSSPSPTSTTTTITTGTTNTGTPSNAPVIDLSTSNITSTSPSTGFTTSGDYGSVNNRNSRSPQQPESSPQLASPQVPASPQGQTLDLSVNRISQRYKSSFLLLLLLL